MFVHLLAMGSRSHDAGDHFSKHSDARLACAYDDSQRQRELTPVITLLLRIENSRAWNSTGVSKFVIIVAIKINECSCEPAGLFVS